MIKTGFKKGFALAEVLIGVSILAIVFMAVSNIVFSSIRTNQVTMTSFSAYQLAQEGVELMRAARDSHWRRNVAWNGNVQGVSGVIANFSQNGCYTVSLAEDMKSINIVYLPGTTDKQSVLGNSMLQDQIHLYSHIIGEDTLFNNVKVNNDGQSRFNRFICVDPDSSSPKMKMTSVVTWVERWNTETNPSTIELTTELTDWKGGVL